MTALGGWVRGGLRSSVFAREIAAVLVLKCVLFAMLLQVLPRPPVRAENGVSLREPFDRLRANGGAAALGVVREPFDRLRANGVSARENGVSAGENGFSSPGEHHGH